MFKKFSVVKVAVPTLLLAVASAPAFAVIDTATMTEGITEAQTAILAVIGALIALSVAIFGVSKVYSFISRKAGG